MSAPHRTPRLVVVGGGFAGLTAVRALRRADVRITLIDRSNHHLFQPFLYQVATAGLSAPDIAAPLRHILRKQRNVTVLMRTVVHIDPHAKQLRFDDDRTLDFDALLLATGATHAYFGHDDWAAHAPGLKSLDDALDIRRRVLTAFEQAEAEDNPEKRAAWLTFAIVGAGPTGVELAGTLAEIARHTLRGEFRRADPQHAHVLLIEAGPRVLSAFTDTLSHKALQQLQRLGVDVRTGTTVTAIDGDGLHVRHTHTGVARIEARTVLWAAGVAASPLARDLGVPLDRVGRVIVAPDLSVPGHPDIFIAGDLAAATCDGKPVPGVAPAAKQMGAYIAKRLRARWRGVEDMAAFKYRDFGSLATIGRMAAVVEMGRLRLFGLPAWWLWLSAHIFFLIGFRNRIVVLIDWARAYWTYQRSARIVLKND